jgi:GH24 family phage-related lysozyme (muramidase)
MLTILTPLAQFLATEGIEGFRLQTYDDKTGDRLDEGEVAVGTASIAVGLVKYSDGTPVEPGDELTLQEAWDETYHYLNKVLEPSLDRILDVVLPDNKLMAFASWLYNFGETKAQRYTLPKLINAEADDSAIIEKWLEYIYAGGKPELGLYRRRLAECLMWLNYDWRPALNAGWDTSLSDLVEAAGGELVTHDSEVFEELEIPTRGADEVKKITDPTPDTPLNTADLNAMQLESLKTGLPIDYGVPMTDLVDRIPVESVQYLAVEDKKPGNITVKKVKDSNRGKGYAKQQAAKELGTVTGIGAAAGMVGAAEPVIRVVDKYPSQTLAYVVVGLAMFAIGYYYYGRWQERRGRDDATDLLG